MNLASVYTTYNAKVLRTVCPIIIATWIFTKYLLVFEEE